MLKNWEKVPFEIGRIKEAYIINCLWKENFIIEIGNKILKLRKKNNLSQEDLAEKVGVERQTISKWELGETSPDLKQSKKLSEIFNVCLDELVGNELKEILVEKVSNTEKKSEKILKIVKAIGIILLIFFIVIICVYARLVLSKNKDKRRNIKHSSITCNLHNEKYFYEFRFYEDNGQIIEAGGDGYLSDITEIEKYNNAYQAINIIDAYVKNNGGRTKIKECQ